MEEAHVPLLSPVRGEDDDEFDGHHLHHPSPMDGALPPRPPSAGSKGSNSGGGGGVRSPPKLMLRSALARSHSEGQRWQALGDSESDGSWPTSPANADSDADTRSTGSRSTGGASGGGGGHAHGGMRSLRSPGRRWVKRSTRRPRMPRIESQKEFNERAISAPTMPTASNGGLGVTHHSSNGAATTASGALPPLGGSSSAARRTQSGPLPDASPMSTRSNRSNRSNRSAGSRGSGAAMARAMTESPTREPFTPQASNPLYHKVKYYESLHRLAHRTARQETPGSDMTPEQWTWAPKLLPPAHVLPPHLFGLEDAPAKPQSSWSTISSIVNTMMGSTIVALPYAFSQTGLIQGVFIVALIGAFSCFTCVLIIHHGRRFDTFIEFVSHYQGGLTTWVSWVTSVLVILGAAIAYHILMQQALYKVVHAVGAEFHATTLLQHWRPQYAALVPLIIYPVTLFKDLKVLMRINSMGFLFVWYSIIFITIKGISAVLGGMVTTDVLVHPGSPTFDSVTGTEIVSVGFSPTFGILSGIITLSFFVHNVIHTLVHNAEPKVAKRDTIIAYSLAAVFYVIVGCLGYLGLAHAKPGMNLANFLVIFGDRDWYALSAQAALVLQLLTLYPLLLTIIRTCVFELIYQNAWPGRMHVAIVNAMIMAITLAFAAFYPKIAAVLRFTGSIGGFIVMFAVPIAIDVKIRRKRGTMPCYRWVLLGAVLLVAGVSMIAQFVPAVSE